MDDKPTEYDRYVAGLKNWAEVPCIVCEEGELTVSDFTKTLETDDTTLIVKEVPALLCDACGDVTYTKAVRQRLDALLDDAVTDDRTTIVRPFVAQDGE